MEKRKEKRLHTKLYVNLRSESITVTGLLCDVSDNGLFIKCTRDFALGEAIDVEIFMPDNNDSLVKGRVKRKIKLHETYRKHGVGIELIEKDARYINFVKSVLEKSEMETVDVAT